MSPGILIDIILILLTLIGAIYVWKDIRTDGDVCWGIVSLVLIGLWIDFLLKDLGVV